MLAVAGMIAGVVCSLAGCSKMAYRLAADKEVNYLVAQKSNDSRWDMPNFTIGMDPRARYFDPTDPDGTPMPYDDPASHLYMHCLAGKKGYPCWHMNGDWYDLENPKWKELLAKYNEITKDGSIKLTMNGSVCLGQVHSGDYRTQIETIYQSALDVSTERFRFDVQFFGDSTVAFAHTGPNESPTGKETNTLTYGAVSPDKTYQLTKTFATGGELLVGFANSFVWQFAGQDSNVTNSLLNFSLIQPLLRNGGRVVALETLTRAERALLANLRYFERYRQGFYANMTVGNSFVGPVQGPVRVGGFLGGTGLTGFSGQGAGGIGTVASGAFGITNSGFGGGGTGGAGIGFVSGGAGSVGGFVGLLQLLQQVRNAEENLNALLRTLGLLEANLDAGLIDIVQVDQLRQQIESARATLLAAQVGYQTQLDSFKAANLGLPPDVAVEPDDTMLNQFQFLDPRTVNVQHMIDDFVKVVGELPPEPSEADLNRAVELLTTLRQKAADQFVTAAADMKSLDAKSVERKKIMDSKKIARFDADRKRMADSLADVDSRFDQTQGTLEHLRSNMTIENRAKSADDVVSLSTGLSGLVQELALIKARARVETVTVPLIELKSDRALEIARANRLDWMNNRAQLVDSWRLIAYNAQALKAGLDLTFSGDLGTVGNNPAAFNGKNGDLRVGLRFDAPFTRRLERNNYRSVLITYQATRRSLYQFQDSVNFSLRNLIRTLEQLEVNLEIQRRAVVIAIRRADKTREDLNKPPAPVLPGQQPESLGPTVAQNLIFALNDLQAAQNTFMSVVLNHLENRILLYRELGIMELDDCGMWIDKPIVESDWLSEDQCPMPPEVPGDWMKDANVDPQDVDDFSARHQRDLEDGRLDSAMMAGRPAKKLAPRASAERKAERNPGALAEPPSRDAPPRRSPPRQGGANPGDLEPQKLSRILAPELDPRAHRPDSHDSRQRATSDEPAPEDFVEPKKRADVESPSAAGPILRR